MWWSECDRGENDLKPQPILDTVTRIVSERKCRNYLTSARETPTLLLITAVTWAPSTPEAGDRFLLGEGHSKWQEKFRIAFTEATNPSVFRASPCLSSMWLWRLAWQLRIHVLRNKNSDSLLFTEICNIRNFPLSRASRWEEPPLNAICSTTIISEPSLSGKIPF